MKAQNEKDNHTKYWNYKNNLDYFRVVGEGAKRSIIGERRAGGQFSFGDGGVNQGWYIGVLATEYAVLIDKDDTTEAQKTLDELFCALMAVERLDAVATSREELADFPNYQGPINGFAVRTDGWTDIPDTAYFEAINEKDTNNYPLDMWGNHWETMTRMERSFYAPPHGHDFFSQDQLYHVLLGLYLTYQYVPGTHTVSCGSKHNQPVNFKEKAREIALRFIHKMADNNFKLKDSKGKTVFGGHAQIYANPLIYLAKAMGSTYRFSKIYNPLWNLSGGIAISWPFNKTDIAHMHLVMASISDARFSLTKSNAKAIYRQAKDKTYNWEAFYPLLHNNLWGDKPMSDEYYLLVEEGLNSAPFTNPENNVNGGPVGWRSYPKFMKKSEHQNNGNPHFNAIYSGLDYMLLYNLYQLKRIAATTDDNN